MALHMLTTIDNPFDPFTEFDRWYEFDVASGYHTSAYLARIARVGEGLSDADYDLALEMAIDEICSENITGRYRKVAQPGTD